VPENKQGHIEAGDTIPQDRSQGALETEKVLGDLLPLLQAVKPAELNATLNALATALQGRGEKLGNTLVQLDTYLKGLNPHTKQLVDDLGKLGRVSDEYNSIAPDLFQTIDNLQTNAHTVIAEKQSVANLFDTVTSTSDVLRGFLADNEQNMITVVDTSAKVYALLAQYSPESTCMFAALTKLYNLASSAIQDHQIRLSIVVDNNNQGKYKPGQQPVYIDGLGPNCFGLPDNPQPQVDGKFQIPKKYQCFNDGAPLTDNPCGQGGPHAGESAYDRSLGSRSENAVVSTLLTGAYHTTPDKVPPIATMLATPLYRGQEVHVR
jgi:ABC-type transporter Mla subunit MlaD